MKNHWSSKPITYLIDDNGCHNCNSHKSDGGYPRKKVNNKTLKISRIVYSEYYLNNGKIPDGLVVRHKCDNKQCINPLHLELGTQKDNIDDMFKRGRANKAIGVNHGHSKITDEQTIEIFYSTKKNKEIAIEYGISEFNVSLIKRKKQRTRITKEL
jgi:hypothetical protein